jgi:hypothetical protein
LPSAATQSPGTAGRGQGGGAPRAAIPFIRASAHHVESPFFDQTFTMNANLQDFGVIEVPAYGYVRNIVMLVTTSGFTSTAASTFNEDAPFNAIQNIQFNEPNGAQIVQTNDGYELYLINKWSGYMGPGLSNDHRGDTIFSQAVATGAGSGSFNFLLRIPVEMDLRSALASLPNQAANATFRVRGALAPSSVVYGTAPTTLGQVRVRMFTESWDQPEVASGGLSNQTVPPAMNTTQFWSRQVYNLGGGGSQTTRLTRVGNYIRNQIFILRSGTGASLQQAGFRFNADTLYSTNASPITFFIDSRPVQILNDNYWQNRMWERSGGSGGVIGSPTGVAPAAGGAASFAPNTKDTAYGQDFGVRVLDYITDFDGNYGRENRNLWQPTLGSTRYEIQATYGALTNGTLTVLTNDVAIAGNVFLG